MGSLYGFEVKTDMALRRLNAAHGTRGELTIELARRPLVEPAAAPVSTLESETGGRWYASYEIGGDCLLVLPPSGSFLLEPRAPRIVVDSRDEDSELLEHRIVSAAAGTLLSMRSDLVLHASAVAADGRAVIFCGPSRRGKSTLARVLGEAGYPVLAEDGVDLSLAGEPTAFPGARGVRVRRAGGGAVDLAPDPGPEEPRPCRVESVVLLDERADELAVAPLEPALALALLTPNLVHSGGREAIGGAFSNLAHLLRAVPAFRASLPDDLDAACDRV